MLDALEIEHFLTLGWSGGGPHALACAALLPGRCLAAATLAGVAPREAAGLDWSSGMADENLAEFDAAETSEEALTAFLGGRGRGHLADVTGSEVADALGGLVPDVDRAALHGDLADAMAEAFRRAVSSGVAGWRDDDLAFVRPWGFDLASIRVPVAVWQGSGDRMVPFAHGQWLAAHVPGARARLEPGEGHLSLIPALARILVDLRELAGVLTARVRPGPARGRTPGRSGQRLRPVGARRPAALRGARQPGQRPRRGVRRQHQQRLQVSFLPREAGRSGQDTLGARGARGDRRVAVRA